MTTTSSASATRRSTPTPTTTSVWPTPCSATREGTASACVRPSHATPDSAATNTTYVHPGGTRTSVVSSCSRLVLQ